MAREVECLDEAIEEERERALPVAQFARLSRRGSIANVSQTMRALVASGTLFVMVAGIVSCGERTEVFFTNADAARRAGAVDRGWIPDWLPNSARGIHEAHDIDTNQGLVAFSFDPEDSRIPPPSCTQVQRESLEPVPFSMPWWPNDLPPSSLVTHRHVYYRCKNDSYVALSTSDGQLYYWRP